MNYEKHNASEWQTVPSRRQSSSAPSKGQGSIPSKAPAVELQTSPISTSKTTLGHPHPLPFRPPPPTHAARTSGFQRGKPSNQAKQAVTSPAPCSLQTTQPARPPQSVQREQRVIDIDSTDRPQRYTFAAGKRDNVAKSKFRRGEKPVDAFILSKQCNQLEPDVDKLYTMLEEIGVRLNSYVRPPQHGTDIRLLIWGDGEAVRATKHALKDWQDVAGTREIGFHEKLAREQRYGRVGLNADAKSRDLDKRMRDDAKKMRYQKAPPEGMRFKHNGLFLWPVDEIRPEELLGQSLEAYDPIRQLAQAHILFESSLSCFKILSNEDSALPLIMKRIEGTMREYVARSSPRVYMNYAVLPSGPMMRQEIFLTVPCYDEKPSIPTLCGESLSGQSLIDFEVLRSQTISKNARSAFNVCRRMLERLQFYRGSIKLRVEFGTFLLQSWFRWSGTPTPYIAFLDKLGLERTRGILFKGLRYSKDPDEIIAECFHATHLLEPFESYLKNLEQVEPAYSARYICRTQASGRVNLEVELTKIFGSTLYEPTRLLWHDMERTDIERPMELQFVNVTGGVSAQFSVCIDNILDSSRITPIMADFADSIHYRSPDAHDGGNRVIFHQGAIDIDAMQQKTAYRFRIAGASTWAFEIARYDTFAPTAVKSHSTHWAGSFWNLEWDNMLTENATRMIGEGASWKPTMDTFFPPKSFGVVDPEAGFRGFLSDMENLMAFLESIETRKLLGGEEC